MKTYEIVLHRTERKTVKLEADSPERAIKDARASNPEFQTDACVELGADGEPASEHTILGTCELCSKMVFDEEEYGSGHIGEDGFVCHQCAEAAFQRSREYFK